MMDTMLIMHRDAEKELNNKRFLNIVKHPSLMDSHTRLLFRRAWQEKHNKSLVSVTTDWFNRSLRDKEPWQCHCVGRGRTVAGLVASDHPSRIFLNWYCEHISVPIKLGCDTRVVRLSNGQNLLPGSQRKAIK
jgi:hypothetical protein